MAKMQNLIINMLKVGQNYILIVNFLGRIKYNLFYKNAMDANDQEKTEDILKKTLIEMREKSNK